MHILKTKTETTSQHNCSKREERLDVTTEEWSNRVI